MVSDKIILRVAINTPVRKLFDYLPPEHTTPGRLQPGIRLQVPFGHSGKKIGLLLDVTDSTAIDHRRLKRASTILDHHPVVPGNLLDLMCWASDYYQHPVGETTLGNLPALLCRGKADEQPRIEYWQACNPLPENMEELLGRSERQKALFALIHKSQEGISREELRKTFNNLSPHLRALKNKGLVQSFARKKTTTGEPPDNEHTIILNDEQASAVETINSHSDGYSVFLLDGVTGSGKTEVYIHAIRQIIAGGMQALVLVPEIGLTPQFTRRLEEQLCTDICIMHSGLGERERLNAWLGARDGTSRVIVGTRSAVWTPLARPGIIIVDEEHDLSYKQQEGFRYSARDIAVVRARSENIPIVLGSATPSMESIHNARDQRYREIRLHKRAGNADLPAINLLDIRSSHMTGALSKQMLEAIQAQLQKKKQVLLFLNRRGYAPVIMCHECGWISKCPRCDMNMTFHKQFNRVWCHHCDHRESRPEICPDCHNNELLDVGHGTQRLLETLQTNFPDARVERIDRDTTRRKGSMQAILDKARQGEIDILVGTQMMAKGHHFPGVTLVGIIDADRGLFSGDYRGSERMGQLILQVSGRAGRAGDRGRVLIQTHYPDHPLLKTICRHDYATLATLILEDRRSARLPPWTYQTLLRAEANDRKQVGQFLESARNAVPSTAETIEVFGPFPAPIEMRAGRYRMQLLLQSSSRKPLKDCLDQWINALEKLPGSKRVRWSLDVDPQDMI